MFGRSELPRHAAPVFGWDGFDVASVVIAAVYVIGTVVFFLSTR